MAGRTPTHSDSKRGVGWIPEIGGKLPRRVTSQNLLRPLNKLHQAILQNDLAKLKARLAQPRKAKSELCETDNMDQTPLAAALRVNHVEFVKELLNFYHATKADINQKDKNGYTALHVASSYCDDQILMLLLNFEEIDVNTPNDDLNTPLHYFCQKFKSPNCQEPFQLFLKRGVNVNAQNKNGETPLHKSILNNAVRLLMVNLLLEVGADMNLLNIRGESSLHFAVHLGREDSVLVLVKAGADVTIRGITDKKTAYELALQGSNAKVKQILKNVQDVYDWLQSLELEQYWKVFAREEISVDLLPDLDEKILDAMGITSAGHRIKILKNCKLVNVNNSNNTPPPMASPKSPPLLASAPSSKTNDANGPSSSRKLSVNSISSLPSSGKEDGSLSSEDLKDALSALKHVKLTNEIWIDPSDLEYTLKLGAGSSGKVYKGLYKGKEVAVKVLKSITTQSQLEEFKKEFQIMSAIRSPYMVTFYGAALEPKLCMVMEFCSRDSLYHVMNQTKYDIGWERFFKFAIQMTRGMDCLHNWDPPIVHRDFKSLNLLVNEDWDCKISDFGLSRFNTADNLDTLNKTRGTFAYCSPEVATGGVPYSNKSDVYSIGIVFWELLVRVITGEYSRPFSEYAHIKMDFQIMLNSKEGVRPTLPSSVPQSLQDLYKETVAQNQSDRPSCSEILAKLQAIQEDYLQNKEEWDKLRVVAPKPAVS